MSIEENGHKNGEIDEISAREDAPSGASFDGLARGLATGTVPRRKALGMLAASLFGGVLFAAPVVAAPRDNRKPGGTGCPKAGQIRNERGECECNAAEGFVTCEAGERAGNCFNPNNCAGVQTFNPQTCKCECPNETDVLCGGQCVEACADTEVLVGCECVTAITCGQGTCQSTLSSCVPNSNTACGANGGVCVNCTTNTNGNTVCGPNGQCVAPPTPTCTPACTSNQVCCTSGRDAGTCRNVSAGCRT